ncbi:MAG: hypothetical protein ABRQ38_19355, partial [Candidatus Eremiobacterota bacterium]
RFWRKIYTVLTASCKLNRRKIVNVCKNRFSFRRIIDFSEEPGGGKVWGDFSDRLDMAYGGGKTKLFERIIYKTVKTCYTQLGDYCFMRIGKSDLKDILVPMEYRELTPVETTCVYLKFFSRRQARSMRQEAYE